MFKKLFSRAEKTTTRALPVVVVSGLPRSGTSMMMKMLTEGGLSAITDAIREADDDNPNGYFEFEPVKQMMSGETDWLADAGGKVVKVISSLLEYLPKTNQYKVIFMEREINEVLASQQKMLANRGEASAISDAEMEEQFSKHLTAVKFWLARQPNLDVMYVNYRKMVASPADFSARIAEFTTLPLDVEKMNAVPNERLYRNRGSK
jgi:hypothetical protein